MTAPALTDQEIAYVVDRFCASHSRSRAAILGATDEREAAKVADRFLRNSGFAHRAGDHECPGSARPFHGIHLHTEQRDDADIREWDGPGWYCRDEDCSLYGYKIAEDEGGWSADAFYSGGIVVTETPRLGKVSHKGGRSANRDKDAPKIAWLQVARYLRSTAEPMQLDLLAVPA